MSLTHRFCLTLLGLVLVSALARAEVGRVWAANDGEKVYRFDSDHPAREGNSVWDGRTIRLRGLRNEVVAFQIIVETDHRGAENLEVAVHAPVHQTSGAVIQGSPSGYGPQGGIEVFSQHYLHVQRPTPPGWFYGSEASAPPRPTGWIPDPLIPPSAVRGRGGFPVTLPPAGERVVRSDHEMASLPPVPAQNQGFWVDVYLPRDPSLPAGLYRSQVRVAAGGVEVARLPLEIRLLDASMPDENHSTVWLYTSNVGRYYPNLPEEEVTRMVKFAAQRHRIEVVGGFRAHRSRFDSRIMEEYRPWLDGSAFTPARGYYGPGEGKGESLFPVGMYGSPALGSTREEVREQADRWVEWFERNAPEVLYFWYLVDEPGRSYYPWIRERAGWIHEHTGSGRRLPVFITRGYIEELAEDIDIWCNYNGVDLERMPAILAEGKHYWFYNGFRPRYGAVLLEAEAVDFRVNAWAKYIHQVPVWFLWEGTHWTHNHQGPKGHLHQRVFSEPVTFLSWSGTGANGDGIVFYPGRNPFYPEEDRGVNDLIGSIRLKNIRRGQQDYELMWLAERKVGRERVLELVRTVVPESLEAELKGPVHWSQRGSDYDRVRERLLDLLEE